MDIVVRKTEDFINAIDVQGWLRVEFKWNEWLLCLTQPYDLWMWVKNRWKSTVFLVQVGNG